MTTAARVARFIETFCKQSRGEWAGRPVELMAWQRDALAGLFATDAAGRRLVRIALIGVPRKNGKSTFSSAIGVYGLIADGEPGAEVYSCAGDREQARIVFAEAKRMIEAEPELAELCTIYRDAIEVPATASIYRVLSSDAKLKHGLNPSLVLFDELHVQPNEALWSAMTQGSGARRQPLVIAITTAGYDEDTLAGRLYQYGKKIQSGEVVDDSFYFRWHEPRSATADFRDPAVWAEANPSLGSVLKADDLAVMVRTTPEAEFRRYRLNQWTQTAVNWLPPGAWAACQSEATLDPALPIYVGIDVGIKHDSSAVAVAQRHADRTIVRARLWENPYPESDQRHDAWKLTIADVEQWLVELRQVYPATPPTVAAIGKSGPEYAYDPHFFERSAELLTGEGLAMVEYPQNDVRMVPASQTFYDLIVSGQIAHDGDPGLARHVGNVVADARSRGWRISKPKGSGKKIDAAIAAAIAVYRAQTPAPPKRTSVYETQGLMVVG